MTTMLADRTGLPDALRTLLRDFPREGWERHPNFPGLVAFWMQRHMMFRSILDGLRSDAEAAVDRRVDPVQMKARLSRNGGALLQELHGHHMIEDHHYFPVLAGMETALQRGFQILDSDHHALDGLLNRFAESANGVLRDKAEPGEFHAELLSFERMLDRHLEDEEDLIVPVLLKHGSAGLH